MALSNRNCIINVGKNLTDHTLGTIYIIKKILDIEIYYENFCLKVTFIH